MEALCLTNQRLLRDLEELTKEMKHPQEEQRHHDIPRDVNGEGETSQAKEHDPYKPPGEDCNEGMPGRNQQRQWNDPLSAGDRGTIMGF